MRKEKKSNMKLKDAETIKDRASGYCFSEEEYKRFCKIIDEEPDALSLEKAKGIVEDRRILDPGRVLHGWLPV